MEDYGFKFLLTSRAVRSTAMIYMLLAVPLYLKAIGISIINIGIVFFGVILFNILLVLFLGFFGDRFGYRRALLISEVLIVVSATIVATTTYVPLIIVAVIVGGIGGAAGGMRGAFSPGLTALVASNWPDEKDRVRKLGLLTSIGSLFSIFGSGLLMLHPLLQGTFGIAGAYKILFIVAAVLGLISFISLLFVREVSRPKKSTKVMKRSSMNYSLRVIAANAFNGFGLGLAAPLLPLWFAVAYNADAFLIGAIFAFSYLTTALGSYISSRTRHSDIVAVSANARIFSGVLFMGMAFSPLVALAGLLFVIRAFVNGYGSPTRSTVSVRGVDREDYGTASSVQGIANRLSQTSTGLSGYLLEAASYAPLFSSGIFQIIGGALYYRLLERREAQKVHGAE